MPTFYRALGLSFLALLCATQAQAQLTYLNVPEAHTAEHHQVMGQVQVVMENFAMTSLAADYGLSHGWQAGFNVFDLSLGRLRQEDEPPMPTLVMGNAQKFWNFGQSPYGLAIGTQQGVAVNRGEVRKYAALGYLELAAEDILLKDLRVSAGGYIGNHPYLGDGDQMHLLLGLDWEFWEEHLGLAAEHFGGANAVGSTWAGLEIMLSPRLPLSLGYRLPNQGGEGNFTFQLTLLPME